MERPTVQSARGPEGKRAAITGDSSPDPRQIGQVAERHAADFLRRQGYRIVDANVRYKGGELDLVAYDGETLVFVEVRARRATLYGTAAESVDWRKRRRVQLAIELYLQKHNVDPRQALRIDVVAIRLNATGAPAAVELIKNAFGET